MDALAPLTRRVEALFFAVGGLKMDVDALDRALTHAEAEAGKRWNKNNDRKHAPDE